MKKNSVLFLFFLCILCVYMVFGNYYDSSILKSCFDITGAEFIRMDIEGTGKVLTDDTCTIAAEKLFKASGLTGKYEINEDLNTAILTLNNKDIHAVIKTKKIRSEKSAYVSVILSQYNGDMNITNIRRTISKAFSIYNVKPSFSSLIQGKYNEMLTIQQMKEKVSGVLRAKSASFVEGVDGGNMVSVSGYINGLGDKISYMGKMVNLNMALRYSRTDGCTYIWVGSPIILLEY